MESTAIPTATPRAISKLEWEAYQENEPLGDCPVNGGLRIFPDKSSFDDSNTYRSKVYLKATLAQALTGVTVYFKVFDPDDPSACSAPIDDDPGYFEGGDNDGGSASYNPSSQTDNGIAKCEVTVTLKPGDNFVGLASCNQSLLDDIDQKQFDARGYSNDYVKDSGMLTVWRHLWFELDKMAPPSQPNNYVFGAVSGTVTQWSGTNIMVDSTANWIPGDLVGAILTLRRPSSTATPGPETQPIKTSEAWSFVVTGNTSNILAVETNYQDDGFDNDSDGQTDGNDADESFDFSNWSTASPIVLPEYNLNTDDYDPSTVLRDPLFNVTKIKNLLKPAFVEVGEAPDTVTGLSFIRNMGEGHTPSSIRDIVEGVDFQCVHVTGCYEGVTSSGRWWGGDNDPDLEGSNKAGKTSTSSPSKQESSVVFIEYHNDAERAHEWTAKGMQRDDEEEKTTIHEALHQVPFLLPEDNTNRSILSGAGCPWALLPEQIKLIRSRF